MTEELAFQAFSTTITPEYTIIPSDLAKRLTSCYSRGETVAPRSSPTELMLLPWFNFFSFRATFNPSKIMFIDLTLLQRMERSLSQLSESPDILTCVRARLLMDLVSLFWLNRREAQNCFSSACRIWPHFVQNCTKRTANGRT